MNRNYSNISYAESPFGTLSEFMSKSFGWMFAGLLVSFAVGIGTVATGPPASSFRMRCSTA